MEGNRSTFYAYGGGAVARLLSMKTSSSRLDPQTQLPIVTDHSIVEYSYNVAINGYTATRERTRDLQTNTPSTDNYRYLCHDAFSRLVAEFEILEIGTNGVPVYLETYHEYTDSNDPFLRTKTTAPNGAITEWQYTPRGNVKKIIDAQGNETVMSYVEENTSHPAYATFPDLVTEIRRPAPDQDNAPTVFYETTKFTYDAMNGNLESVEDADGEITSFPLYNSSGQVKEIVNRRGFKTLLEYDSRSNVTKVSVQKSLNPLDNNPVTDFRSIEIDYDAYDNLLQVEDANGNTVSVTYDGADRPLTITDGNTVDTVFEYVDRVLKQVTLPKNNDSTPNTRLAKTEYDSAGRPVAVKRQDNNHGPELRVGFSYNGFSQLTALKRLKNGVEKSHTSDEFDRQGRLLKSTDANGQESTAAYEPYCVGMATTSARGVRRKASFDTLCRLTEIEVGTPATDPLEVTNASEIRTFEFDDLGRVTKTIQGPSSSSTPSVYGQAKFGQSSYGSTTGSQTAGERSFEYDALDRLKKVTFEDGKTMLYEHDVEGNVTQVTENASGTSKVTQFSYYGDNRLHAVTYVRSGGNQVFTYAYDPGGRPLTLTYPASTGIVAEFKGPNNEVGWDGNGQLKFLQYRKGTDILRRFEYGYDPAGNRISQLDVKGVGTTKATSWAYGYDWIDRLETVNKAEAATVGALGALQLVSMYTYDAADNRTKFEVPQLNEVYESFFDDADNITRIDKTVGSGTPVTIESFTSDPDGNLLTRTDPATSVVTTYQWDDFNRLKAISTTDNSKKQTNTFGVNGFRRKKKDKNDVETTEYAAGLATAVSKATGGDTITYLMGHRLMGFERSSDGAMFWFLTDALSTVRDVVSSSGAVVASYEFSEYGQKISPANTGGVESQKTFVGGLSVQDEVADTGLMMMGHRFYDPSGPGGGTGRFLNRDPIGFGGGLNLFAYAGGSPTVAADASGLKPCPPITIIPRNTWGGRQPISSKMKLDTSKKTQIVIHHQGNSGLGLHVQSRENQVINLQKVQNMHMDMGYGDIGYNYAIDAYGEIYKGRGTSWEGAHVEGENPGTIGILILGSYNGPHINDATEFALCDLLINLVRTYGLDLSTSTIKGHNEVVEGTECPGSTLSNDLAAIVSRCKKRRRRLGCD